MFFGDHAPPHFHAEYGEYKAQISIANLGIIEGYLPPKALALVVEWASLNRAALIANWRNLSETKNGLFVKIEPLR